MSKKKAIYLKLPGDFKGSVVWGDWGSVLEDYELKDVIEFEAEVASMCRGFLIDREASNKLAKDFKPGESVQVLLVVNLGKCLN